MYFEERKNFLLFSDIIFGWSTSNNHKNAISRCHFALGHVLLWNIANSNNNQLVHLGGPHGCKHVVDSYGFAFKHNGTFLISGFSTVDESKEFKFLRHIFSILREDIWKSRTLTTIEFHFYMWPIMVSDKNYFFSYESLTMSQVINGFSAKYSRPP